MTTKRALVATAVLLALACLVGNLSAGEFVPPTPPPDLVNAEGLIEVPEDWTVERPDPDLEQGLDLYVSRCATCHGIDGDGAGSVARFLDPAPRDFTLGVYRIRSTITGEVPTDEDIFRTITSGFPGTAMPAWSGLTAEERWQLVFYLKSLSPWFDAEYPPETVAIPDAPPPTAELVDRGAIVYDVMGCAQCHGPDGRGDGPASGSMVDDLENPIYPFDMTRAYLMKGGRSAEDIYRTFHTGLNGTPMPSYDSVISDTDTWALVYFTQSLFLDQ